MPSQPLQPHVSRLAAFAAGAAACAVAGVLAPAAGAALPVRDDPIFAIRVQDDSDVTVRCANGVVEVVDDGVSLGPFSTPCAEVVYVEVEANGSGDNVIDLSGVTPDAFPAIPARFGILVEAGTGDDTVVGTPRSDLLFGGEGNDRIDGGAGDDIVHPEAGTDVVACGAGDDLLTYATATTSVAVDLASPAPYRGGDAAGDTSTDCEHLRGGSGPDRLGGRAGAWELDGGAGDDVLLAAPGNRLLGGSGLDTASFERFRRGVTADLSSGVAQSSAGSVTLADVERLTGSRHADVLDRQRRAEPARRRPRQRPALRPRRPRCPARRRG